jgi:hypothetical protein
MNPFIILTDLSDKRLLYININNIVLFEKRFLKDYKNRDIGSPYTYIVLEAGSQSTRDVIESEEEIMSMITSYYEATL